MPSKLFHPKMSIICICLVMLDCCSIVTAYTSLHINMFQKGGYVPYILFGNLLFHLNVNYTHLLNGCTMFN